MNILVVGNGFDLAHGLPTKYGDFLGMIQRFKSIINEPNIMKAGYLDNIENPIYAFLDRFIFAEGALRVEFNRLIEDNFWIEYFLKNPMYQKENWIDFESEISKVIKQLNEDMYIDNVKRWQLDDEINDLANEYLKKIYYKYTSTLRSMVILTDGKSESVTFRQIRDRLYSDLNRLIRALEIYMTAYIEQMECNLESPDINNICFDGILSFNYTDTYEKLYDSKRLANYDYIHGKANIKNKIYTNNMVLGIDEYLPTHRKDKDVDFISFKKFYQRIYKETGCEYRKWVDDIRSNNPIKNRTYGGFDENGNKVIESTYSSQHNLYIFGHSLDVTDGDILKDLILNDNVHTTIYYVNKDVMGQQIVNLVKVIGQDELIKRTGGKNKTIEFKKQADMIWKSKGEE
jgi:hypothetical protein